MNFSSSHGDTLSDKTATKGQGIILVIIIIILFFFIVQQQSDYCNLLCNYVAPPLFLIVTWKKKGHILGYDAYIATARDGDWNTKLNAIFTLHRPNDGQGHPPKSTRKLPGIIGTTNNKNKNDNNEKTIRAQSPAVK